MNNGKLQRVIVHIGGHKSGSTSIQDFCSADKKLLLNSGIFYPANLFKDYPRQHSHLAKLLIAGDTEVIEETFSKIVTRAKEAGAHSVFLSGEDLGVMSARHISDFAAFCDRYFNERRFVFVARNRRDFVLSSYKHFLRYARILSEIEFAHSFSFSPSSVIDNWRANFSLDAVFLHYDEIRNNFVRSFFREVFALRVDHENYSNVSLDFLTSNIFNIFLKEWPSQEVNQIIWRVSCEHTSPMSFAIEERVADSLCEMLPAEGWEPIEYQGRRPLSVCKERRQAHHDPIEVCDKMLSLFQQLRTHFEQCAEKDRNEK